MCTNFENSAVVVLRQFIDGPKTEDDLYRYFGDQIFRLSLGGLTISQFLDSLEVEGYLTVSGGRYSITPNGTAELEHLENVVKQNQACGSS